MRKIVIFTACLTLLLLSLLAFGGCGLEIEYAVVEEGIVSEEGYIYSVYENNTACITGYEGQALIVTIPDELGGSRVTEIGDSAFSGVGFFDVTLGKYVERIGDSAFSDCDILMSIDLGQSLTRIGEAAFSGCRTLARVALPKSLTYIAPYAFSGCDGLTRVSGGRGLTEIASGAFEGCSALCEFKFNSKLEAIGKGAFSGCTSLGRIEFDVKKLETIPDECFTDCQNLAAVEIPDGVTHIGKGAFRGCTSLSLVSGCADLSSVGSSVFAECPAFETMTDEFCVIGRGVLIKYNGSSPNVVIPDNVKYIADVFFANKQLLTVSAPSVTDIGEEAFVACSSLVTLNLGRGIKTVGRSAFAGCSSLKTVNFAGSEKSWKKVTVDANNAPLTKAELNCK